jgi:hypothetical protein
MWWVGEVCGLKETQSFPPRITFKNMFVKKEVGVGMFISM